MSSHRIVDITSVVRGNRDAKCLLAKLYDMADEFEDETGAELELVINEGS